MPFPDVIAARVGQCQKNADSSTAKNDKREEDLLSARLNLCPDPSRGCSHPLTLDRDLLSRFSNANKNLFPLVVMTRWNRAIPRKCRVKNLEFTYTFDINQPPRRQASAAALTSKLINQQPDSSVPDAVIVRLGNAPLYVIDKTDEMAFLNHGPNDVMRILGDARRRIAFARGMLLSRHLSLPNLVPVG